MKKWWNRTKETILYHIVNWWYYGWIYQKMVSPVRYMEKDIDNSLNREDAEALISRKCYRFISKKYKEKLLNEKFD